MNIKIIIIAIFFILNTILGFFDIIGYTLKVNFDDILELMVKAMYGMNYSHYRANIMFYSKIGNSLKIYYSFNMMGHKDRKFTINLTEYNDLCASVAFNNKVFTVLDTNLVNQHTQLVAGGKIWENMQSVASVPILNKKGTKAIGVLNIDSDLPLNSTEFREQKKYIVLNAYSDIIKDTMG